jgi:hypothetical protein
LGSTFLVRKAGNRTAVNETSASTESTPDITAMFVASTIEHRGQNLWPGCFPYAARPARDGPHWDTAAISLDLLRTRHREKLLLRACLPGKQSFVVDNTNVAVADRQRYIIPAKEGGFIVTGYYFGSLLDEALARNHQPPKPESRSHQK